MRVILWFVVSAVCAAADPLSVSTNGTFDSSTSVSSLTAPGAAWSLSFDVDSMPVVSNVSAGDGFDVAYSNFEYLVNGSAVTLPVADIRFFASGAPGGLFSVCFETECPGDAPPDTALVFEGGQAYTGSEAAPGIVAGSYTPSLEGVRDGSLRQVLPDSTITIAAVASPEPASFGCVAAGFLMAGLAARWRAKGPRR